MSTATLPNTGRIAAIDILRALTMFFMLFVNDLWTLHDIPKWLGHMPADANAMGFADIIFPLFMFIVGLSIPMAINARKRKGAGNFKISIHILNRTLALVVMGFFMVNLENINKDLLPFSKYVWQILMALAFVLIWNTYKKGTYWDAVPIWLTKTLGVLVLLLLAYVYKGGTIDNPGWMEPHWWGILGIIGWAYLFSAFVYLVLGNSLLLIALVWGVLHLLHLSEYVDALSAFSSIKFVVGYSNHICVLSGCLATMIYLKYGSEEGRRKQFLTIMLVLGILITAYGFMVRPLGGIAKLGGTPSWTDISVGVGLVSFAVLFIIADIFNRTGWAKVFAPAGRSTLTTYLIPYFYYAIMSLVALYLPQFLRGGMIGIIKSLLFSFLIVWITSLFEKAHLKLRI